MISQTKNFHHFELLLKMLNYNTFLLVCKSLNSEPKEYRNIHISCKDYIIGGCYLKHEYLGFKSIATYLHELSFLL